MSPRNLFARRTTCLWALCAFWLMGVCVDGQPFAPISVLSRRLPFVREVVPADIDNDGLTDLVTVQNNELSWMRNMGGTLSVPPTFSDPFLLPKNCTDPNKLRVGFIDGDNTLDMVYCGGREMGWTGGVGPSTNADGAHSHVLAHLDSVCEILWLEDINADGHLDVLVATLTTVFWLANDGNGVFTPQPQLVHGSVGAAALTDLNVDGVVDLVFASNDGLSYRLGTGGGAFGPPHGIMNASYVTSVLCADFTGNGYADVVATTLGKLYVIVNKGLGDDGLPVLEPQPRILTPGNRMLSVADVNGDGWMDILLGGGQTVAPVYFNKGGAQFSRPAFESRGADSWRYVVAADMRGAGVMDVILISSQADHLQYALNRYDRVMFDPNTHPFPAHLTSQAGDAVAGQLGANTTGVVTYSAFTTSIVIFLYDNTVEASAYRYNHSQPLAVTIDIGYQAVSLGLCQLTASGRLDIVVASLGGVVWLRNDGLTQGVPQFTVQPVMGPPVSHLVCGDVTGSGHVDMIGLPGSGEASHVVLLSNNGNGVFKETNISAGFVTPVSAVLVDVENDGDIDILLSALGPEPLILLLVNNGTGSFTARVVSPTPQTTHFIVADINNDGLQDLVMPSPPNQIVVRLNIGDGLFDNGTRVDTLAKSPIRVVAGDITGSGWMDVCVFGSDLVECLANSEGNLVLSELVLPTGTIMGGAALLLHDITGDGLLDLVFSTDAALQWRPNLARIVEVDLEQWLSPSHLPPVRTAPPVADMRPLQPFINRNTLLPSPSGIRLLSQSSELTLVQTLTLSGLPTTKAAQYLVMLPPQGVTLFCCLPPTDFAANCLSIPSSVTLRWTGGPLRIAPCPGSPQFSLGRVLVVRGLLHSWIYSRLCVAPFSTHQRGTFCAAKAPVYASQLHQQQFPGPPRQFNNEQRPSPLLTIAHFANRGAIEVIGSKMRVHAWPSQMAAVIDDMSSVLGGTGLSLSDAADLVMERWVISRCSSSAAGGGISAFKVALVLKNVTVESNRAEAAGGGLIAIDCTTVTLDNVIFRHNNALGGGGLSIKSVADTSHTWNDIVAFNNTAVVEGGFMLMHLTYATWTGGVLQANRAIDGQGGGVSMQVESSLRLSHVQVTDNEADSHGGGINLAQSTLLLYHSELRRNRARLNGGAIRLLFSSATALNSVFEDNSAGLQGGAMQCEGVANLLGTIQDTHGVYQRNTALQGGALYMQACKSVLGYSKFSYNRAVTRSPSSQGGAVGLKLTDSLSLQISQWGAVVFEHNWAYRNGGALWTNMETAALAVDQFSRFTNNTAVTGGGGGVYHEGVTGGLYANETNPIVTGNHAVYAPNIGTNARFLEITTNTVSQFAQQSGEFFQGTLVLTLHDNFGNVVKSDSSSTLSLRAVDSRVLVIQTVAQAKRGVFNLTGSFGLVTPDFSTSYSLVWVLNLEQFAEPGFPVVSSPPELNVAIGPCATGTFWSTSASRCRPCPPGTFSDTRGATACKECTPGTISGAPGADHCSVCQEPTYAQSNRSTVCSQCTGSTFWVSTTLPCGPCTGNQIGRNGVCVCPPFTVVIPRPGGLRECAECADIPGALCLGNGTNLLPGSLKALPGYWKDTHNPLKFYSCPFSRSCESAGCSPGSMGPCCIQCVSGRYRSTITGACEVCPSGGAGSVSAAIIGLFVVVLLVVCVYMHKIRVEWIKVDADQDEDEEEDGHLLLLPDDKSGSVSQSPSESSEYSSPQRPRRATLTVPRRSRAYQATALFKIVVGHIQILVLIVAASGSYNTTSSQGFPAELRRFTRVVGIGVLRLFRVVPLACASSTPFQTGVILTLTLPLMLVALVAAAGFLLVLHRRVRRLPALSWVDAYRRGIKAYCVLIILVYPLTTAELLETFYHRKCGSMLDAVGIDAGMLASSSSYRAMQALSGVGLCVYTIGIPLLFLAVMYKNRRDLWNPAAPVALKYSFLYQDLKPSKWWFFPITMLEKVSYAVCVVFLAERLTDLYTAEVLITVASVVSLSMLRPYSGWYQTLLVFSRLVIFLTIFGAVLLDLQHQRDGQLDSLGRPTAGDSGSTVVSAKPLGVILIVLNLIVMLLPCAVLVSWAHKHRSQLGTSFRGAFDVILRRRHIEQVSDDDQDIMAGPPLSSRQLALRTRLLSDDPLPPSRPSADARTLSNTQYDIADSSNKQTPV